MKAITAVAPAGGRNSATSRATDMSVRWMPHRLFAYERQLGLRELESLGLHVVEDTGGSVTVHGDTATAVQRATYFEAVSGSRTDWNSTEQARVETVHRELRGTNGSRQATRYGLHGIHEYKGKFNPQVVRALCNVVDADADVLIDPFCGSGTSLIEGLRLGMRVVGIDHSPIACFIAEAKLRGTVAPSKAALADGLLVLAHEVADAIDHGQATGEAVSCPPAVGRGGTQYLQRWFTPEAYAALANGLAALDARKGSPARSLALVALSSILRSVSLQLPEDLRVRRRPEPFVAPPMAPLFMEAARTIQRGLLEMQEWPDLSGEWTLRRQSAEAHEAYVGTGGGRRLVITSPPYATALPYIDTDRLSAVALGLAESTDLLDLERSLIGSREWTRPEQTNWDTCRIENRYQLPREIIQITAEIAHLNEASGGGFRRQAVASLLYRYFARMGEAFKCWADLLEKGEAAVLIVGHNHTTAGGTKIAIQTPDLLGRVGEARGFEVEEVIKLETWPRYGLHAANGVAGEDAVVLRRAGR